MGKRTLPFYALGLGLCLTFLVSPSQSAVIEKESLGDIKEILKELRQHRTQPRRKRVKEAIRLTPPKLEKKKSPKPSVSKTKKKTSNLKLSPQIIRQSKKQPRYVSVDQNPSFDIPVTYNAKVKQWINYFQTRGSRWFKSRLERSFRYLPVITSVLRNNGLPQDLGYIAMVESGFSARAISSAQAVGYWQFIQATANRYGLKTNWWLDERRDYKKSTQAAGEYLSDLYKMFGSWYLSAAAYNMGENRLKRLMKRHNSRDFWYLSKKRDFPRETRDYIPKLLAAMLIAKAPKLYGFKNIKPQSPYSYEYFHVPGGTDLHNLAKFMQVNKANLKQLNPELTKGFVPKFVKSHRIRIPKGRITAASQYIRKKL